MRSPAAATVSIALIASVTASAILLSFFLSMSEDANVNIALSELKSLIAETAREAVRAELAAIPSQRPER